jgi:hypothetical protein
LDRLASTARQVAEKRNTTFDFLHAGQVPPSSYQPVLGAGHTRNGPATVPGAILASFGDGEYLNGYFTL